VSPTSIAARTHTREVGAATAHLHAVSLRTTLLLLGVIIVLAMVFNDDRRFAIEATVVVVV